MSDLHETYLELMKNTIGENTKIWGNTNVYGATIGSNCSVGFGTEIGFAKIGNNVRIGALCFLCEGNIIEDDVFIAPRVGFTNDKYPPASREAWLPTVVKKGASIGAGCTILCGITIGEGAMIGAGSTVTKDVPSGELWAGTPAHLIRKIK